jgi:HK97 family phage major capsid protein
MIKELQAKRATVQKQLDAILTNDFLSADDRNTVKSLEREFDWLSSQISESEQLLADDAAARNRHQTRQLSLTAGRGRQTNADEQLGFIEGDGSGSVRALPPGQFHSLGEQLQAIAGAELNPGREDNRLRWESLAPISGGAQAQVPSDGGYAIQKDFMTDLTGKVTVASELLSRVRKVPIGANADGLKVMTVDETSRVAGSRWGGVQMYWAAEADVATAKKPKFRLMELELKDLIGLAYVTDRLLQDASALEAVFTQSFSEETKFMLEDSCINGTGAGMPQGILAAACTVSQAKETGQAAVTFVYENALNMWSRMWARSRANAVWHINQDVEPQLNRMSIPVGTGGMPVYLPPGGLSQSPYATLFGRPIVPLEYCATLGTVGDVILADWTQYLMIDKGESQFDQSIHVRFTSHERTFRFITRADGQPIWNSAMTPFKGSATKSPFVTCATRA